MMLQPLSKEKLLEIFDGIALDVLNFCMKKTLMAQPERLFGQSPLPIQVPKEHIEQWIVQAIGGMPVGAGSYPIDILKPNEFGADIKMMSCKINSNGTLSDTTSGEASLAQKFSDAGVNLDTAFANSEYDDIARSWVEILANKLKRVEKEHGVKVIYYIFILRAGNKFYLCATEVFIDEIQYINANNKISTKTSVFLDNLIDSKFGNAKIYKSKKRLELRLKPKYWVDNGYVLEFNFENYISPMMNLRKKVEDKTIDDYLENIVGNILDAKK